MDNSPDNLEYLKNEIEHLKYANKELNSKLDEKTEELSDNKLHFKGLRAYIKELEKQKQEFINKNDENNVNIEGMQEQLQNNKLELHTLTEEKVQLNFVIKKEKQSYTQLEQKCDQIDEQLKNTNTLLAQTANRDRNLSKTGCDESENVANKLHQLQSLKDSEEKALKEQIEKLNREITELKSSNRINQHIDTHQNVNKMEQNSQTDIQTSYKLHQCRCAELEKDLIAVNNHIQTVTLQRNSVNQQFEDLKNNFRVVNRENTELDILIISKDEEIVKISGELKNLKVERDNLKNNFKEENQKLNEQKFMNNEEQIKILPQPGSYDPVLKGSTTLRKLVLKYQNRFQPNIYNQGPQPIGYAGDYLGTQPGSYVPFLENSTSFRNQASWGYPNNQKPVIVQQMVPKWICSICNQNFETEREMDLHVVHCIVQTLPSVPTSHPSVGSTQIQRRLVQKPDSLQLDKPK